jgi:hypothetical protein
MSEEDEAASNAREAPSIVIDGLGKSVEAILVGSGDAR